MAVIKGKPVADSITAAIKEKTEELKNKGVIPVLDKRPDPVVQLAHLL